jgi:hypothetical protein
MAKVSAYPNAGTEEVWMRRAALALAGTAAGTVLLVAAKLGPAMPADALIGAPGGGLIPPGASVPAGTPPPSGTPGKTPMPGSTTSGRPTASAPGTPTRPGTTTSPPGGGGGGGTPSTTKPPPPSQTVTGVAVAVITAQSPSPKSQPCSECHDYTIAVTITVSGGRITSAGATYNPSPGGSLYYADKADTVLKSAILTAQTWNLGRVSGATYAGNAWELSVKDAMSRAGMTV